MMGTYKGTVGRSRRRAGMREGAEVLGRVVRRGMENDGLLFLWKGNGSISTSKSQGKWSNFRTHYTQNPHRIDFGIPRPTHCPPKTPPSIIHAFSERLLNPSPRPKAPAQSLLLHLAPGPHPNNRLQPGHLLPGPLPPHLHLRLRSRLSHIRPPLV